MTDFTSPASIDYTDGIDQGPDNYPTLADKFEKTAEVVDQALAAYGDTAVMWTGGKDSTLVLYVVLEVARERGFAVPPVIFIDHFEHFEETTEFVDRWVDEWDLDLFVARNEALAPYEPGESVPLDDLDERTRRELDRVGHEGDSLTVDADSLAGNHLLKTAALNDTLIEHGFDAVFSGVRWDEQDARADETFFSPRHEAEKYPPHDRVHPILQFEERDVWDAFWGFILPDTVEGYDSPRSPGRRRPRGLRARGPAGLAQVLRGVPLTRHRIRLRRGG